MAEPTPVQPHELGAAHIGRTIWVQYGNQTQYMTGVLESVKSDGLAIDVSLRGGLSVACAREGRQTRNNPALYVY